MKYNDISYSYKNPTWPSKHPVLPREGRVFRHHTPKSATAILLSLLKEGFRIEGDAAAAPQLQSSESEKPLLDFLERGGKKSTDGCRASFSCSTKKDLNERACRGSNLSRAKSSLFLLCRICLQGVRPQALRRQK